MLSANHAPLLDVLRNREIIHPTRVVELQFGKNEAILKIEGYPWWLPSSEKQKIDSSEASIRMASISLARLTESCLLADAYEEDLEDFAVSECRQEVWNQGVAAQVFCTDSVQNIPSLLSAIDDFLCQSACPINRSVFLYQEDTFSAFVRTLSSSSFQLCRAPMALCQCISKELKKQEVRHNIVSSDMPFASDLLVKWRDGFIICQEVIIEWDGVER